MKSLHKSSVLRDINYIILWWKAGVTLQEMALAYQVRHSLIPGLLRERLGEEEYRRIRKQHRADANERSGVRWKKGQTACYIRKGMESPRRAKIGEIRTYRVRARNIHEKWRHRRFIKTAHDPITGRVTWVPLSKYRWEQKNGSVPEGYFLTFVDGKSMHDELDNLKLVSYEDSARHALNACDREKRRKKIKHSTIEWRRAAKSAREVRSTGKRAIRECAGCGGSVTPGSEKCPKCGSTSIAYHEVEIVPEYVEPTNMEDLFDLEAA